MLQCFRKLQKSRFDVIVLSVVFLTSSSLSSFLLFSASRFNKIQNTKNTMKKDGISSLTYRLVQVKRYPLYTNISVEIGKPPPRPIKG